MCPIRKSRFFRSPWPPATVTPYRSRRASRSSPASMPSGVRMAGTTAEGASWGGEGGRDGRRGGLGRGERARAPPLGPLRGGANELGVAIERGFEPLVQQQP